MNGSAARPPTVTIRDATLDDAAQLGALLAVLGYPTDTDTVRRRLTTLLTDDPTARILVAVRGPTLLGFVTIHATPVLHRPTAVGRITALAVAAGQQGSGVGRALVAAAETHCAAQGWTRLEVTSGPTHSAAHAFYRHLGYEDQGIRFAKVLAPRR